MMRKQEKCQMEVNRQNEIEICKIRKNCLDMDLKILFEEKFLKDGREILQLVIYIYYIKNTVLHKIYSSLAEVK